MIEIDIELKWSYPKTFESVIDTEVAHCGYGIYYISRKFGQKETLLYIGITYSQNFRARLNSHAWKWFSKYRGKKIIRFGEFITDEKISNETIIDVESALIFGTFPKHNTDKQYSYKYDKLYRIKNKGYRGEISQIVSMKEQIECNPTLIKPKLKKVIISDSEMMKQIEEEIPPQYKHFF